MANLSKTFTETASEKDLIDKNIVREAIKIVSRGNVNLQLGRYITQQDIDALKEEMINYSRPPELVSYIEDRKNKLLNPQNGN